MREPLHTTLKKTFSGLSIKHKQPNGSSPIPDRGQAPTPRPSPPLASIFKSPTTSSSSSTLNNTASYFEGDHSPGPNETGYEPYRRLRLNDTLTISIGDSFEANPSGDSKNIARFDYGPIRQPKLIRLLLILPTHDKKDPLETILFHAEFDEVPFQAVSTIKSTAGKTKLMHCNGRGLPVTESIYNTLVEIRNAGDISNFSALWVDAVCINRTNVKERETHLRLARGIFSYACVTLAHLGGTEKQRKKAFDAVDKLHAACDSDEFREKLERDEVDLSSLENLSINGRNLSIPVENRLELSRLFSHHWFERIWNWQELVVAKKVCIMYGGEVRSWASLADVAWCMHQLHWESSSGEDLSHGQSDMDLKHYHILHLDEHRDGLKSGQSFNLLSLLCESRHFTAKDPLDQVFALYPLIGNGREQCIVEAFFDYSLTARSLFLNISLNCIRAHGTLDVFHLAQNDCEDDWPSFVPDLSVHANVRVLGSMNGRKTWHYKAAGESQAEMQVLYSEGDRRQGVPFFEEDVQILLKGVVFDEIESIGTEMKGVTLGSTSFLTDWVNTALCDEETRFYTTTELKRARNALQNTLKDLNIEGIEGLPTINDDPGDQGEDEGDDHSKNYWTSRRGSASTTGPRRSSAGEARSNLRSTFSPALLRALKKLEENPDAGEASAEIDALASLPTHRKYPDSDISTVEAFWRTLIKNQDRDGEEPTEDMYNTHFQPWFKAMSGSVSYMLEALAHGHSATAARRPEPLFNDLVHVSSNGTRIMRSKKGYIGTVPRDAREGDLVCVLYGGQTPFILHPDEEESGKYRLVGDSYVHGLMKGEAMDMKLPEQNFQIY